VVKAGHGFLVACDEVHAEGDAPGGGQTRDPVIAGGVVGSICLPRSTTRPASRTAAPGGLYINPSGDNGVENAR
jgi:hypothetical protein